MAFQARQQSAFQRWPTAVFPYSLPEDLLQFAPEPDLCIPVPFAYAESTFPNVRQVDSVHGGLIGWSQPEDNIDDMLFGDSGPSEIQRYCTLAWTTTLPRAGFWEFERIGVPTVLIRGVHTVAATGTRAASFDASVSVLASLVATVVEPGGWWVTSVTTGSSDSTRSETRTKAFNIDLPLPAGGVILAKSPAQLWIFGIMEANLWIDQDDSGSLAGVSIAQFGLPVSVWEDASRVWKICPFT